MTVPRNEAATRKTLFWIPAHFQSYYVFQKNTPQRMTLYFLYFLGFHDHCIWEKVFKNGPSKNCGRNPLKKLKEYGLLKANHTPTNFLKVVFHKFYLVHSWILCLVWSTWKWMLPEQFGCFWYQMHPEWFDTGCFRGDLETSGVVSNRMLPGCFNNITD